MGLLALRRWLRAPGSLSARLAALGHFEVRVISEGPRRLLPGEARDLGHVRGWVREVVLQVDGVPLVWARSVAPCRTLAGPWRALRGIGTRPLAELLWRDDAVRRSPLRRERHRRGGPWHARAEAAWRASGAGWPGAVLHGRSSVFERRGGRLRLFEGFVSRMAGRDPVARHRLGR